MSQESLHGGTALKARQAQCRCGRLSLTAGGDPIRVSVCHCHACQRRTGSAFGVQARFLEADVDVSGSYKRYSRVSSDGNKVNCFFCPDCGSTVFIKLEHAPDLVVVPVGAFADHSFPGPTVSIYEAHRHPWVQFENDVEHID